MLTVDEATCDRFLTENPRLQTALAKYRIDLELDTDAVLRVMTGKPQVFERATCGAVYVDANGSQVEW